MSPRSELLSYNTEYLLTTTRAVGSGPLVLVLRKFVHAICPVNLACIIQPSHHRKANHSAFNSSCFADHDYLHARLGTRSFSFLYRYAFPLAHVSMSRHTRTLW